MAQDGPTSMSTLMSLACFARVTPERLPSDERMCFERFRVGDFLSEMKKIDSFPDYTPELPSLLRVTAN